ncbi:hypothetical protein MMC15_007139 [Xylographa vitiligo]|nr:hypothetical protein [Xylographa vitiligo]
MNPDEQAAAAVLTSYQDALNASSTDMVMKLYAPTGILMAQHYPSSIGTAALHQAYDTIFNTLTLKVKFTIEECNQVAPDWIFARTSSAGTATLNASGEGGPEANQELFVLQKIEGTWKIARYCFCTTNPPKA